MPRSFSCAGGLCPRWNSAPRGMDLMQTVLVRMGGLAQGINLQENKQVHLHLLRSPCIFEGKFCFFSGASMEYMTTFELCRLEVSCWVLTCGHVLS